ncbi:hypothetical protein [Polyangium spumosum]|uniref:Uncharacterized protein n=1 Tax=Polyangium spumosum TaxID=889282 RepID=A0A6N7PP18_9BACT|nr:hypothetical protein [Polyangium spumosum]MRG93417.1 hypothetical protein [Polyangium spumosum]
MATNSSTFAASSAARLVFLGGVLLFSLMSGSASAAACRDLDSVKQSADPSRNTAMGGHLTQHILGMRPPPGTSQVGKTLFSERGKFELAWRVYMNTVTNPRTCSGRGVIQVFDLGFPIDAFSCRRADGNGQCTDWASYHATQVSVAFLFVNGSWILNTAFPMPID